MPRTLTDGVVTLRPQNGADPEVAEPHRFEVEALGVPRGTPVGTVEVRDVGDHVGQLAWTTFADFRGNGFATRAVRLLVGHAFADLGFHRTQAYVESDNRPSLRVAARAGLRREGLMRGRLSVDGVRRDLVVLARLAEDPAPETPAGFVGLVNSSLPRTRLIAHVVIRDDRDRVLLCEVTYKTDWELPGGVVEPAESPRDGAARETREELGVDLPIGRLMSVDWLPPWHGWDDAVEMLFDGGTYDNGLLDTFTLHPREIRKAEFCTLEEIRERARPGTFERLVASLAAPPGGTVYLERGAPA